MAGPLYYDRVQETSTTTGTGTYTLAGAVTGYRSFSVVGNSNTCYYAATDGTNWEVGLGTYTSAGTTLARTTILSSSNANAAVSWAAGTRVIWLDLPAAGMTTIAAAKTFAVNNSLTLAGTDSTTMTFPSTSATVARTDAANTFTGVQTFGTPIAIGSGGTGSATGAFTVVRTQVFTNSGTYTPNANMLYCEIECQGAGGGGGGTATASASNWAVGGGGGGGVNAWIVASAATIGASQTVTVGAAGTAGTAGNNVGGTGGTTSVGSICSANGGNGGGGSPGNNNSNGGAAVATGTGTVVIPGQAGIGWFLSTVGVKMRSGGGSPRGTGGMNGEISQAGQVGSGYGAGGGGGSSLNAGGAFAGGAGTAGLVIIKEYCSA